MQYVLLCYLYCTVCAVRTVWAVRAVWAVRTVWAVCVLVKSSRGQ